ncbi:hypothetical protein CVT24_010859 [Panaeolus cyanescens]|uniref:Ketoreductase (KR) domain-containing protein n=1 Tax=Panaeolus cyanescens TaxID=181874 RepID=A0A409WDB2_9AGAR|nr:hypothetical protein CVT24_010859 [Panaeolus cyanescens]
MPSLEVVKVANADYKPDYIPVMVITGSTFGIGQKIVEIFAKYTIGRAHIVLVGRNEAAANEIISGLPPAADGCTYEFLPCDLRLMKNVRELAKVLRDRLPKINFLIHSAGVASLEKRVETEEGIDEKMAIRYYCRFALTYELLPLLRKAKDLGEQVGVLAILGAGLSKPLLMDDLGLKKGHTGMKSMQQTVTYNDLMIGEFARREEGIAFVHAHPGFVDTFAPKPLYQKVLNIAFRPLIWLLFTTPDISAEHMLYALLDSKPGMSLRNRYGDDVGKKNYPTAEGAQEAMWAHSVKETGVVEDNL